jgi:hypothetical protein
MTEMTPIVNSVHTSNDSLQRRRLLLSVVTRIDSDCSEPGDMMEMTPILNCVLTSNDSLERRRATQLGHEQRESSVKGDMMVRTPIVNSVHTSKDSLK